MIRTLLFVSAVLAFPLASHAASSEHPPSELTGTWRGRSICTDRIAAPACNDESVIYEFTPGARPDTVHWKADKIADGKRVTMGEFDLVYSRSDSCWKAELTTPRFHMIWSVAVHGAALDGSAMLLPGRQVVRKIEARRD